VPQPYFPNAPLHQRLESSVARRTGARGWDYWRQRRVRLMHREEDLALFAVRGDTGSVYEVSLRIDGTELMASCECPYVEMELDLCKHIWATVLEASHQGWFQNARSLDLDVFEQEAPVPRPRKPPPDPEWKRELEALQSVERPHRSANIPPGAEIHYTLDVNSMRHDGSPTVEIGLRTRKKNGELSKPRSITVNPEQIAHLPDERDREILSLASGGSSPWPFGVSRIHMAWPLSRFLLPRLCNTGRLTLRTRDGDRTATWDGDTAWTFAASVDRDDARYAYIVSGHFERGEERLAIHEPLALLAGGLLFMSDRIAPLDDGGAFEWIALLRHRKTIEIPFKDAGMLPRVLAGVRRPAQFAMPDELRITDIHIAPVPCLTIRKERFGYGYTTSLCFDYQGTRAEGDSDPGPIFREEARTVIHRDVDAELAARLTLKGLGASHHIDPRKLDSVIHALLSRGWRIEGEQGTYRTASDFRIEISSGIDWFDLNGEAIFGDQHVSLPDLLEAARKGESIMTLDDGTLAMIPGDWLASLQPLIDLAAEETDRGLRYRPSQAGILDVLLEARPDAHFDEQLLAARTRLEKEIVAGRAPETFRGTLRDYQRDGLGWFEWLRELKFGGCLADDMGLGKTIQVLALLESRRNASQRPSLVVVPRSLIFNWKEEAARFTPELRVVDSSGSGRARGKDAFNDADLVLTTYGTLRRDITWLSEIEFDYAILDEAQAIKSASSQASKAARLLRAQHRLALSGTPIENHLGELWSLFEFLNPGMFGKRKGTLPELLRPRDEADRRTLARAVRPFILRRTKEQVARELPPCVEQTIHCELGEAQRKLYDDLRAHYRQLLLARVAAEGMQKSKIYVLEALLRLRQASCHPGLIRKDFAKDESAKLESLMSELDVVLSENHKVLVFSQFTSFLSIVRERLDAKSVDYCYLDGKTKARDREVERFQSADGPSLFLISLKAGGLGLNLTAAEYVFLLDPWWNPAVEAQAIDRAHRIGQQRRVFAYRLVARDTIEEKILALQESKRALADAIIGENNSVLRGLTPEDLDLLLS